jgi:acetolactate synthase-1/2/3 large subunit
MKITGAQGIIKSLENENVDIVFGYPGATIAPFYDAIYDSDIKHILTRSEQGAAHAASGYSRISGKVGVCVATSGPGATNLITGLATANMDSIPIVAITGQVSSDLIGKDGFQEVDIVGATTSFCKHNYTVKNEKDITRIIKEAFYIASTGRPGPVLIDIPVDIQKNIIEYNDIKDVDIKGYKPKLNYNLNDIKNLVNEIEKSSRPVICAGGGIIRSKAHKELYNLSKKCNIPIVTTLMGKGAIHFDYDFYCGMMGTHGVDTANYAVKNADLLIIIGARVGDRALGKVTGYLDSKKIIHIDIDAAELGKNINDIIPFVGDAKDVLIKINEIIKPRIRLEWNEELEKVKNNQLKTLKYNVESDKINPKYLMSLLSEKLTKDLVVTTEVGQNQIWAANHLKTKHPNTFLTSGGLGTMGYGMPAAIGAKVADKSKKIIVVSGDGSFQISMNELGTIKQNNLGIKVIMFNNSRLGMVRELQEQNYGKRYSAVYLDENPDFIKLFEAYGFKGRRIYKNSEINLALNELLEDDKTFLLECIVDSEEATLE